MPSLRSVARDAGVHHSSVQRRRRRLKVPLRGRGRHTLTPEGAARVAPEPIERVPRPGWLTADDIRRRWPDAAPGMLRRELAGLEHVRVLAQGERRRPVRHYDPRDVAGVIDRCRRRRGLWPRARLRHALGVSENGLGKMVAAGLPHTVWKGRATWYDPHECARWLMAQRSERRRACGERLRASLERGGR